MRFRKDFTVDQLATELQQWTSQYTTHNPQGLRFGQYICNQYMIRYMAFPELYYEEDPVKAYGIAVKEITGVDTPAA